MTPPSSERAHPPQSHTTETEAAKHGALAGRVGERHDPLPSCAPRKDARRSCGPDHTACRRQPPGRLREWLREFGACAPSAVRTPAAHSREPARRPPRPTPKKAGECACRPLRAPRWKRLPMRFSNTTVRNAWICGRFHREPHRCARRDRPIRSPPASPARRPLQRPKPQSPPEPSRPGQCTDIPSKSDAASSPCHTMPPLPACAPPIRNRRFRDRAD